MHAEAVTAKGWPALMPPVLSLDEELAIAGDTHRLLADRVAMGVPRPS